MIGDCIKKNQTSKRQPQTTGNCKRSEKHQLLWQRPAFLDSLSMLGSRDQDSKASTRRPKSKWPLCRLTAQTRPFPKIDRLLPCCDAYVQSAWGWGNKLVRWPGGRVFVQSDRPLDGRLVVRACWRSVVCLGMRLGDRSVGIG